MREMFWVLHASGGGDILFEAQVTEVIVVLAGFLYSGWLGYPGHLSTSIIRLTDFTGWDIRYVSAYNYRCR